MTADAKPKPAAPTTQTDADTRLVSAPGDVEPPANDNGQVGRDDLRRKRQKADNERLQVLPFSVLPPSMSLAEMLRDCVWIAAGSQVGRLSNPRDVLNFKEFADLTAASATFVKTEDGRRRRPVLHAVEWKHHAGRITVNTRTFRAGAGPICHDPDGQPALNSWRPIERGPAKRDIAPFIEHVEYLFADPVERAAFLDWLAHAEQRPGELPHFGWLHIAANTGTGRNWLASVLARVWRGYVAPNVDLPALLESQFNGQLAGRTFAIVDEIQEGGGENPYRHVNRLKSLLNAEFRDINPKFGRQYREHNSCRWLVFSNHENALPLTDTDRRWRVVGHRAPPRPPWVYVKLYALLDDAEFINAVGAYLQDRDIRAFNPGERPPVNEAKRAAVAASKSLVQQGAEQLVQRWPVAVITNLDAAEVLGEGQDRGFTPAMRRAMNEAGAIQYSDGRLVKVRGRPSRCWILRQAEQWTDAAPVAIATEVARARPYDAATSAMDLLAGDIEDEDRPF